MNFQIKYFLLISLLLFNSASYAAQSVVDEKPLFIQSGVKIKSAHTFVGGKDVDGKWKFRDGTVVNEGEYYGWIIEYSSVGASIKFKQTVQSPGKTQWDMPTPGNTEWDLSDGTHYEVTDDGRGIAIHHVEQNDGLIGFRWLLVPEDPRGKELITVEFEDGQIKKFEFELR